MMLYQREFNSYEEYYNVQGIKAATMGAELIASSSNRISGFRKLFKDAKPYLSEGSVLCLGARTGCEVIAAQQEGLIGSVGVDLHPIGSQVIQADWAELPFEDSSFSNVFTNSTDHALDIDGLIAEIHRVLKPKGVLFLMVSTRADDKAGLNTLSNWQKVAIKEALYWDTPFDVADAFVCRGFDLDKTITKGKWNSFFLRCLKEA